MSQTQMLTSLLGALLLTSPTLVLAYLISLNMTTPPWPLDLPGLSSPVCPSVTLSGLSDQKHMPAPPTYLPLHSLGLPGQSGLSPWSSSSFTGAVHFLFTHSLCYIPVLAYFKGLPIRRGRSTTEKYSTIQYSIHGM